MPRNLGPDKTPAQPKTARMTPQAPGGSQLDAPRRVLDQSGLNNNAQAAINLANELDRPADPQAVTAAMTPLQLTGAQLSQVMVVAQPIPLDLRGEYFRLSSRRRWPAAPLTTATSIARAQPP